MNLILNEGTMNLLYTTTKLWISYTRIKLLQLFDYGFAIDLDRNEDLQLFD